MQYFLYHNNYYKVAARQVNKSISSIGSTGARKHIFLSADPYTFFLIVSLLLLTLFLFLTPPITAKIST